MMKIFRDLKNIIEAENTQFNNGLKSKASYNTHIALGVSLFIFIVFTIYQFIFVYLDGHVDFRLMYLFPVLCLVLAGPITSFLYKKGCYSFIGKYTIFILHFLMYGLAFWLDCFTDPSLCQIYTLLIIAVGPVLFYQTFLTELVMNAVAFILYLSAVYFKLTPLIGSHGVVSSLVAYAVSIFTLIVIAMMRYRIFLSTKDLNKEKSERERYKYAASIAEALSYDFLNVYSLNLNDETWKIIKRDGYFEDDFKAIRDDDYPYKEMIESYIDRRVYIDDKKRLKKQLDINNIKKELETKDAYVDTYRILEGNEEVYCQFRYVKVKSTNKVIVGFKNVDHIVRFKNDQNLALKEALSLAKQANNVKTNFLNNISHDIRTPMNAIMGFAKHASLHIDDNKIVKDSLRHIDTSGNQLLKYVNNILEITQSDNNRDDIILKPYSLKELLNELLDKTINLANKKDISVEADFTQIYNDNIKTNKERFFKAILAVLENAVAYTPKGGHISFNVRQGSNIGGHKIRYVFTVKDNGVGMSKEYLQHVFDEFSREKDTTNSGISGSGLGLCISKNILQSTGGDIIINSELNKGTEVTMVAVLHVDDNTSNDKSVDLLNEPSCDTFINGKQFKETRILIVDDNMINRQVAKGLLEEKGFVCKEADSGPNAIVKFKDSKPKYYEIILMDILMPEMDGFETTNAIRSLNRLDSKDVLIIALSANESLIDEQKAISKGMNAFLNKPFNVDEFISCVNSLVK